MGETFGAFNPICYTVHQFVFFLVPSSTVPPCAGRPIATRESLQKRYVENGHRESSLGHDVKNGSCESFLEGDVPCTFQMEGQVLSGQCSWQGHGDLLIVDGQCQEFLRCADRGQEQERINVTFRWIEQHVPLCPMFRSG